MKNIIQFLFEILYRFAGRKSGLMKIGVVQKHVHLFSLKWEMNEVWVECKCGEQHDIPEEFAQEAVMKIVRHDFDWPTFEEDMKNGKVCSEGYRYYNN